ncbi:MAG: allantoicase [Proteobacteria bacterium]|jgi:allantoicase|nr:allantoicase [Pseudomonadota bacterium]
MSTNDTESAFFAGTVDLVARSNGGQLVVASDDFFAARENLIESGRGVHLPDRYSERGKWRDGWQTRQNHCAGHHWCIAEMALPGIVRGIDIDTNHFGPDSPLFASIDACCAEPSASPAQLCEEENWQEILPQSPIKPNSHNLFGVVDSRLWTHIRLNIYPDGGVARLRVFGEGVFDAEQVPSGEPIDLLAAQNGGRALMSSDGFSARLNNLLSSNPAASSKDGWAPHRNRRGEHFVIFALGTPGTLENIEVDTHHFANNCPRRCAIDGLYWPDASAGMLYRSSEWVEALTQKRISGHTQHNFTHLAHEGPFTHIRLRFDPDGGFSRLRLWGHPNRLHPSADRLLGLLNNLTEDAAVSALQRSCGSPRWAQAVIDHRPFFSRTALLGIAENLWWKMSEADWKEAFSNEFAESSKWFEGEQRGVKGSTDEATSALAEANQSYEAHFGYRFILCSADRTHEEILALLHQRLVNDPADEIRLAAAEQIKIVRTRLQNMEPPTV